MAKRISNQFKLYIDIIWRIFVILTMVCPNVANPTVVQAKSLTEAADPQITIHSEPTMRPRPSADRPEPVTAERPELNTAVQVDQGWNNYLTQRNKLERQADLASATTKEPSLIFIENEGQFDKKIKFVLSNGLLTFYFADDEIWATILEPQPKNDGDDTISGVPYYSGTPEPSLTSETVVPENGTEITETPTPEDRSNSLQQTEIVTTPETEDVLTNPTGSEQIDNSTPDDLLLNTSELETPSETVQPDDSLQATATPDLSIQITLTPSPTETTKNEKKERKNKHIANIRFQFQGIEGKPVVEGISPLDWSASYFLGNDRANWRTDVKAYSGIRYVDIYPGVDLEITSPNGEWSWKLVVTDENKFTDEKVSKKGIRLKIEGARELVLDQENLQANTDIGNLLLPLLSLSQAQGKRLSMNNISSPRLDGDELVILAGEEATETPTATDSETPTLSPTGSLTPSETPTVEETITPTLTETPIPSETPTPKVSSTSTLPMPTDTETLEPSATLEQPTATETATTSAEIINPVYDISHSTKPRTSSQKLAIPVFKPHAAGINDLLYGTYIGGSGDDNAPDIAVDDDGNIYFVNSTNSINYPIAPGLFQFQGGYDIIIGKLSETGEYSEYLAYFGGSDNDSYFDEIDIEVDKAGSAYVIGSTESDDIPVTSNAYDPTKNSIVDTYLVRVNPAGDQLLYSSYFGGNNYTTGYGLVVFSPAEVYLGGSTCASDFPTTVGAFDTSADGGCDGYISKFNLLKSGASSLVYSTYIGGTNGDQISDIAVQNGEVYFVGQALSTDLPVRNAYDSTANGLYDVMVGILNKSGSNLSYLSYLGGSDDDCEIIGARSECAIAVGPDHSIYVTGKTESSNFPIFNAYNPLARDAFITRINPSGTSLVFSTYFGGSIGNFPRDIITDETGAAYIVGDTAASDFPTTENALDRSLSNFDAFITKIVADGSGLAYSSYIGGSGSDGAVNLVLDDYWYVYIGGSTNSLDFPVTSNAFEPQFSGDFDSFIVSLGLGEYNSVVPDSGSNPACGIEGCASTSPNTQEFASASNTQENSVINTNTGALNYTAKSDESIPTSQGDLSLIRSYNSSTLQSASALGPGWTHNHDLRLIFPGDPGGEPGLVLYKAQSVNIYRFADNGDGTYSPEPGLLSILEKHLGPPITYTVTEPNKRVLTFNDIGKITSITDPQGFNWQYQYDGSNRLQRVTDVTSQHYLNFGYNGQGQLTSVTDDTNRTVSFGYDAAGNLSTNTDVMTGEWSYTYDANHHLRQVIDPRDVVVAHVEYDGQGRAYQQYDPMGTKQLEISYQEENTQITDYYGNTTTHTYNPTRKTLLNKTDASGSTTVLNFNYHFRPINIADGNQNVTQLYWSPDGKNLTTILDAGGSRNDLGYDVLNNLTSHIDGRDYLTTYVYNTSDPDPTRRTLLLEVIDPLNQHTYYTYTTAADAPQPSGLIKTITDAQGHITTFTYNSSGQRINSKDFLNHYTYYTYDNLGRLKTVEDPSGKKDWTCYDAANRVVRSVINASGNGGSPQTDPCNATQYIPSSDPSYDKISSSIYDASGNLIASINQDGAVTRTYYDTSNRPYITVQNWVGVNLQTDPPPAYDPLYPDQNIRTEVRYDAESRVIATIDAKGVITRTYYDGIGRPQFVVQNLIGQDINVNSPPAFNSTYPDRNVRSETVYDSVGNVIATKDTVGLITRTYYDASNRPISVVQNLVGYDLYSNTPPTYAPSYPDRNVRTDTIYDAAGNAIATKDANGVITRTYYDALNRPKVVIQNWVGSDLYSETPPTYNPTYPAQNLRTDYYYDSVGNLIVVVDPNNIVTRTYFDEINRPVTVVQNWAGSDMINGPIPTYNPANPDENVRTDTIYSTDGKAIAVKQWNKDSYVITRTYYDDLNRPFSVVNNWVGPDIYSETIPAYNPTYPDRNVQTQTVYDTNGDVIASIDNAGKITRTYFDKLHRAILVVQNLVGQTIANPVPPVYNSQYPDRNVRTQTVYDADGSVIKTIDPDGKISYSCYNDLKQQVKSIVNPSVSNPCTLYTQSTNTDQDIITFTFYNAAGNVYIKRDPNGKDTVYHYDALNRLIAETDPKQNTSQYIYDANGNQVLAINAKQVATRYEYDALSRLTAVVENYRSGVAANAETNVRTEYTYDPASNRLTIKNARNYTTGFAYDGLNRLISETDPLSHVITSSYDALGNRTRTIDANGATINFQYDALNRPILIDYPNPDTDTSFTYDAAGNRVTLTDGTGTTQWGYDNLYRPTSISAPTTGTVQYGYQASGLRKTMTYPDSKQSVYVYDNAGRLSTVTDWNSLVTSYSYDRAGQTNTMTRPNSVVTTYQYDNSGQVTSINNTIGSQALSTYQYAYDQAGNRISATESLPQQIQPPTDLIFANGFESGNLASWSSNVNDGGDLSATAQAAITGSYGMQAVLDDNTSIYVVDDTPAALNRYRARFYFDPNSIPMGDGDTHEIFQVLNSSAVVIARISFRFSSGDYQLRFEIASDSATWQNTSWVTISDSPHAIEIDWKAATAAGANNGQLSYYLDSVQYTGLNAIDNDTLRVDSVRLGAVNGVDTTTRGTYYFDIFESHNLNYIGLDVNAPAAIPLPLKTDFIDSDGFESGNFSAWARSVTDGGNLSVSTQAAMIGTKGMQALINDTNSIYVTDWNPRDEDHYRTRFYFDPNSIQFNGTSYEFYIFTAQNRDGADVFRIELSKGDGDYYLRVQTRNDQAVWSNSPYIRIMDAPHAIEVEWKSVWLNQGYLTLWVDNVQLASITTLDNDTLKVDTVNLGVVSGVDANTTGTIYFDGFVAQRDSYIGLDPNGPQPPVLTDLIFKDGFESGDLTKWSGSSYTAGDLLVNAQSAIAGTRGLQVVVSGTRNAYLIDRSPSGDTHYRARFYFDPNSIAMANGNEFELLRLINPSNVQIMSMSFSKDASGYRIGINNPSPHGTTFIPITDTAHSIEFEWDAASSVGANDGVFRCWIDGILKYNYVNIHYDIQGVEYVYLGVVSGIDSPTTGSFFLDAFESHRSTFIGAEPGVALSVIFGNGFEEGDLNAWSSSVTDSGDLQVSLEHIIGLRGLKAVIDDTNPLYVVDENPSNESHYRARFYFDPATIRMGDGDQITLLSGENGSSASVLKLQLRFKAGDYQVRVSNIADSATWVNSTWYTVTDGPHALEVDWQKSTAPGANNGHLDLYVDNTVQRSLTGLDNDLQAVDRVKLGVTEGVFSNTHGVVYFDAFESRRDTFIGAETGAPTPPPFPTKGETIFSNGFEGGNLVAWSDSATDGGDLSVNSLTPIGGSYDLSALIDDNNNIYVTDWKPFDENHYRARFYLNPYGLQMANHDSFEVFVGYDRDGTPIVKTELRFSSNEYLIRVQAIDDSGIWHPSKWIGMPRNPTDRAANMHTIEIDWFASTAPGANDGRVIMYVDPNWQSSTSVNTLDNDLQLIGMANLGVVNNIDSGTRGTLAIDLFASQRNNYIGLDGSAPQPVVVTKGDSIFEDGFESGDLSAWTSSTSPAGDLSVTTQAAIGGTYGMQVAVDDTQPRYVTDFTPWVERREFSRFYFNTNSLNMAENDSFYLFDLYNYDDIAVGRLELGFVNNDYQLRIDIRDDQGVYHPSSWTLIRGGVHLIEMQWATAGSSTSQDGFFILTIDGAEVANVNLIDNDSYLVSTVKLGAVEGLDAGTAGTFYVDAYDSHRSTAPGADPNITLPGENDLIFMDGFESGNLGGWSSSVTDGGHLSATSAAKLGGSYGMQAAISDTNSMYVIDLTPFQDTHYRARFYFDPNSVVMANTDQLDIFQAADRTGNLAVTIQFGRISGEYRVRAVSYNDSGVPTYMPWISIGDSLHAFEFEWYQASDAGTHNGSLRFWLDDEEKAFDDTSDNDALRVDYVRMGAVAGVDSGTSGTLYFDLFESRHDNYIDLDASASIPLSIADNFETGNMLAWSSTATDDGDLSITSQSAILGSNGLHATIDDLATMEVVKDFQQEVSGYHVRFYFDPNSVVMANQNAFYLLKASYADVDIPIYVEFRKSTGDYMIQVSSNLNDYSFVKSPWVIISDGPHAIEVEWSAATAPGANNGRLIFWFDGVQKYSKTDMNNDQMRFNKIELGTIGVDSGTSGSVYLDGFIGTPDGYIGTDPNAPTPPQLPAKNDAIFSDGFESGNFSAWSTSQTDGGNLSVTTQAAIVGTKGMQALVNDNNSIFVTDYSPWDDTSYRARFYFDPNSAAMANGNIFSISTGLDKDDIQQYVVEIGMSTIDYQVRAGVMNDAGSLSYSSWTFLANGPHAFEVYWKAATSAGSNNGSLTLWMDGTQIANLTSVDNDTRVVDQARLGAVAGIDTGTRGTMYFDAFVSRRTTYIDLDGGALPPKTDSIFADGLESGDFSAWSASVTNSGKLSVTTGSALVGTKGMNLNIANNTSMYVSDYTPFEDKEYRVHFHFDPNTITMATGNSMYIFYAYNRAGTVVARIEFYKSATSYQIQAAAVNDSTGWTSSGYKNISDAPHTIQVNWKAATSTSTHNGILTLLIDGSQQYTITTLDNDTRMVDYIRWGGVDGIDTGTRGNMFMDGFESKRTGSFAMLPFGDSLAQAKQPDTVVNTSVGNDVNIRHALKVLAAPAPWNGDGQPAFAPNGDQLVSTTITYTYDPLNRLTAADISDGTYYHYTYDATGNLLTTTTLSGTVTYVYDNANRMTSMGGVTYTWDNNGNLTNDGVKTYAYDSANRLKSVTGGGNTYSYVYNGLNNRVRQVINGVTTNYVLDQAGGLSQVLQDGTYSYVYGNGRIAQKTASAAQYYLGDALGSVRQMTDASGAIVLTKTYKPYGEVLSSSGTGSSMYGFDGEQTDVTGMIYLRARYYAPYLNRFTSRDQWAGDYKHPMSYNDWVFGYGNPVKYRDPSGYIAQSEAKDAEKIVRQLYELYQIKIVEDWKLQCVPVPGSNRKDPWHEGYWSLSDLQFVKYAVEELSLKMWGSTKFQRNIGPVILSKSPFAQYRGETRGLTKSSTWIRLQDDPLKQSASQFQIPKYHIIDGSIDFDVWTVVHELAHAWDLHKGWRLSKLLEKSTGGYTDQNKDPFYCNPDNTLPGCNTSHYYYGGTPPKGSDINFTREEDFAESVTAYVFPNQAQSQIEKYKQYKGAKDASVYLYNLYYEDYTKKERWKFINDLIIGNVSP